MTTILEIRQAYPQYEDMSDEQLAHALHRKFYSGVPFKDFSTQIGLAPPDTTAGAPRPPGSDGLSQIHTGLGGFIEGIPVAGPLIRRGAEHAIAATLNPFSDLGHAEIMQRIDQATAEEKAANPVIDTTAQIAGAVTGTIPAAATRTGAKVLGMVGDTLKKRAAASLASGATLSAADQVARDFAQDGTVNPGNAAGAGVFGAGVGVATPFLGAGARKLGGAVARRAGDAFDATFNPSKRAARQIGQAIDIDRAAGQSPLNADDVARAGQDGQVVLNADRGGDTTRALARAATGQDPVTSGAFKTMVSDRFEGQVGRAVRKLTDFAGGKVDDIAAVNAIRDAARISNQPALEKAFKHPRARDLLSKRLRQLLQSPAMQSAVENVPARSADRGAVQGFGKINNPFEVNSSGTHVLRRRADGTLAVPDLRFWNQVEVNLDGNIGRAWNGGDPALASDLKALKGALVEELENAVPSYAAARKGAAAVLGAEDAVDAGRLFARTAGGGPEFRRGIARMTGPEREAFKVGFASEIIDRVRSVSDRADVISMYFSSPESRQKMVTAFGKPRAAEFEAFVRVENALDMMRKTLGESTAARQFIESGMVSGGIGAVTWVFTGDMDSGVKAALAGAAARAGARKINARVMRETARMLMSDDPRIIRRAIKLAARSPQHMAAVDAVTHIAGGAMRGLTVRGAGFAVSE